MGLPPIRSRIGLGMANRAGQISTNTVGTMVLSSISLKTMHFVQYRLPSAKRTLPSALCWGMLTCAHQAIPSLYPSHTAKSRRLTSIGSEANFKTLSLSPVITAITGSSTGAFLLIHSARSIIRIYRSFTPCVIRKAGKRLFPSGLTKSRLFLWLFGIWMTAPSTSDMGRSFCAPIHFLLMNKC